MKQISKDENRNTEMNQLEGLKGYETKQNSRKVELTTRLLGQQQGKVTFVAYMHRCKIASFASGG
jgi:hypothetical protein